MAPEPRADRAYTGCVRCWPSRPRESRLIDSTKSLAKHNWQRWGSEDQKGAANLIQPSDVVAASGLVRSGRVFVESINLVSLGLLGQHRTQPVYARSARGSGAIALSSF